MKMGIKEFRERLGEVARGREPVQLTDRGRIIGTYTPWPQMTDEHRARALLAIDEHQRWMDEERAKGTDFDAIMADLGLDQWGAPLAGPHDR